MALITMTPLVDVMMILLVFFMVTSTYLDLDMMPMVQSDSEGMVAPSGPAPRVPRPHHRQRRGPPAGPAAHGAIAGDSLASTAPRPRAYLAVRWLKCAGAGFGH